MIKAMAPKCMKLCPQMCKPLGAAAGDILKGRKEEVMKVVCAHRQAFSCAFHHHKECVSLRRKAKSLGFSLPADEADLTKQCR